MICHKRSSLSLLLLLATFVGTAWAQQEEPLEVVGGSIGMTTDDGTKLKLWFAHESETFRANFVSLSGTRQLKNNKFWQLEYFGFYPESPLTGNSLEDHRFRIAIGKNWQLGSFTWTHRSRLEYRNGQIDEAVRYRPMIKVVKPLEVNETNFFAYMDYEPAYDLGKERFIFSLFKAGFIFPLSSHIKLELGYVNIYNYISDSNSEGSNVGVHFSF